MQPDIFLNFADTLRGKKGIQARSAVLVDSSERVDIIRGKDFARWIKSNADTINLPPSIKSAPCIILLLHAY